MEQAGAGVARRNLDENASRLGIVHDRLQLAPGGAALADRATPTIVHHVRPQCCVGILPVEIGGSDEELEALGVSGRGAVALIHISATDPLCPRSHSNLVARSTVAHCRAGGVRPVAVIITEGQVVWAARSASRVDAVVPIVIVISSNSIPSHGNEVSAHCASSACRCPGCLLQSPAR